MYHCFASGCRFETEDRATYVDHTLAHTARPGECVFHGRVYPEHDFYYGPECRRCGARKESK